MTPLIREKEYRSCTGKSLLTPEHSILHPLYVLLFILSAMSVLWQHGHPGLTLALLPLTVIFAAGAYLPFRFFPPVMRFTVGLAVLVSVFLWIRFRILQNIPFDLIAAETLCIVSLAQLGGGRRANYRYLTGISLFLLAYGALTPRLLYLILFFLAMLTFLALLAGHRTESIASAKEPLRGHMPKRIFLILLLIQGCIFLGIFWYTFSVFPARPVTSRGIFEVAFQTSKERAAAKELQEWLKPPDKKRPASEKGTVELKNAGKASSVSNSGTLLASLQNAKANSSIEGDGGAAPPSDELIFESSMPARLYHAASFYDEYDGYKWVAGSGRTKGTGSILPISENTIELKYRLHRLISDKLYAPYLSSCFMSDNDDSVIIRNNFRGLGAKLLPEQNIVLPFEYKVMVTLPSPDNDLWKGASAERILNTLEVIHPNLPDPDPLLMSRSYRYRRFVPAVPVDYERLGLSTADALTHYHLRGECLNGFMLPSPTGGISVSRVQCRIRHALSTCSGTRWNSRSGSTRFKRSFPPRSKKRSITVNTLRFSKNKAPFSPERTAVLTRPAVPDRWRESVPRDHFLRLPKQISRRLKQLTSSIVAGKKGSFEKGIALRDWLRTRMRYRQFAGKPPKNREPVDWFVFKEKEGHCEYFASALAVMARIAGIPSRVVIGFSPGDFNTLTGLFEVKGYHAHAWTQLFMEGVGWLTFDATPPSAIPVKTTPVGIGKFRDPFGDEWKITPPEMVAEIRKMTAKRITEEKASAKKSESEKGDLLEELAETRDRIEETLQKQFRISGKEKKESISPEKQKTTAKIRSFFRTAATQFTGFLSKILNVIMEHKALAGVLLLVAASFFIMGRILASWLRTGRILSACRNHALAGKNAFDEGKWGESVREDYLAWRCLLLLAGFRRRKNEELLDFLAFIRKHNPEFGTVSETVFTAFYIAEYSGNEPSEEDASKVKASLACGVELTEKTVHLRITLYPCSPFRKTENKEPESDKV